MKTTLLIILDGWGHRTSTEYNAISAANTPYWDRLIQTQPHRLIHASAEAVGLPAGQIGNSEVGHMQLGAGRVIYQNLVHINKDIADGTFAQNPVIRQQLVDIKSRHKALHIIGLLSPGGIHSHQDHISALIALAKQQQLEKFRARKKVNYCVNRLYREPFCSRLHGVKNPGSGHRHRHHHRGLQHRSPGSDQRHQQWQCHEHPGYG